ncbi:aminotransferase-like domain-containing protein [Algihabitans albus]|uniref:aminotransferase-like domain-containing protein n=1 Tax=Algihabitans albus TaxID=2164067 RepID=UPI000E5CF97D|nr:PLP-dependent aminotransferase family protein [Algihabitans albus]
MTTWIPELRPDSPRYIAIANALADDMGAGLLAPGVKLPTHRDLAWRLGVTVGTVTRAYAEAERRGLVIGEVGRGTFVRAQTPDRPPSADRRDGTPRDDGQILDLSMNLPALPSEPETVPGAVAEVSGDPQARHCFDYTTSLGLPEHRQSGADWLARHGLESPAERIVPTYGAQHAMFLACATLAEAGAPVLVEEATFYGMKSIAKTLDLRLIGVQTDSQGLDPASLDAAARSTGAKLLYCIPNFQNPTSSVMPAQRRDEIAEVCARNGIAVIEDDIYAFLLDDDDGASLRPLSCRLPDQSFYIGSLSKSVSPALRVGWLAVPEAWVDRIAVAQRATVIMPNPLLQEAARRLIESGAADRLAAGQRQEAIARQRLATEILSRPNSGAQIVTHPNSFHIWLQLPPIWRTETFVSAARRRGVAVTAGDVFFVGRVPGPPAVRICLSAAPNRAALERGLRTVASLLSEDPTLEMPLV